MKNQTIRSATWVQDHSSTAWVAKDPRSVHAMLHGKGDGRETLFAQFEKIKRIENPAIGFDQIAEDYERIIAKKEAEARTAIRLLGIPLPQALGSFAYTVRRNLFPLIGVALVAQWLSTHVA